MVDISNYDKLREDAQHLYTTFEQVICPALDVPISFSSHGFNHVVYRKGRNERDRSSQIMRFKLLARAYELVSRTITFQEYEETLKEFVIKKNKQKQRVSKTVRYWGLIAILNNRKIKVIIRKVGNGTAHFWSVIPAWVTNKNRDEKFIRTMKGDPEQD